ncbi:MAG TPA: hypothetical protein VJ962_09805 [Clostridia bacterium]|nr:hypothetical protein [Clostridia bacterium]
MFKKVCQECGLIFQTGDSDQEVCQECQEKYYKMAKEEKFYREIEKGEEKKYENRRN